MTFLEGGATIRISLKNSALINTFPITPYDDESIMTSLTINLHSNALRNLRGVFGRALAQQAVGYQPSFASTVCPTYLPASQIGMGWSKGTR